jgi:uncharacterized membrane protein
MLFVSVSLGTIGQILLKLGMMGSDNGKRDVGTAALTSAIKAIGNPKVFFGFVAYGISSIIWLMILKKVPLSWAYPMISISYVLVVIFSAIIIGEKPHWAVTIPGLVLIIAGVSLIGLGSGK